MSCSGYRCAGLVSLILAAGLCGANGNMSASFAGDELRSNEVRASIARGVDFLRSQQAADGSFHSTLPPQFWGTNALVTLALLNAGPSAQDPCVARALDYLRDLHEPDRFMSTYEGSLLLMALVAAREWDKDRSRIAAVAKRLEEMQTTTHGAERGMWNYGFGRRPIRVDNSNTQFAVLGLHDAVLAGVPVKRETWEMAMEHFVHNQNRAGGWGYWPGNPRSTGSMTCSGIASLVICQQMLALDEAQHADGAPDCCERKSPFDRSLRHGVSWLAKHFRVDRNPYVNDWLFYYLYSVERAGRLAGQRFFGEHDWYREGARYLLDAQSSKDGSWSHEGGSETDKVLASSFALLFLSKGLAPVLINKLQFASAGERSKSDDILPNWNLHPNDIRNLTEHISTLPDWPKLLTFQEVELEHASAAEGLAQLRQAPILYLGGAEDPNFTDAGVQLLRGYIEQGGFIVAVNNCNGAGFDRGIRSLASRLFPSGDAALKRLPPDHPIYHAEYQLDPAKTELWGADSGCRRTSFVYAPEDHACLWDKWPATGAIRLDTAFGISLRDSMQLGVNIVAFATGHELHDKLDLPKPKAEDLADADRDPATKREKIERGLLQVAKLRHTGDWDAAPRALHRVLVALNQTSGVLASTRQQNLVPGNGNLPTYPLTYMHGRSAFRFSPQEIHDLRNYLNGGAVLFADACCGSPQFDQSMRDLIRQLFPDKKLEPIPITHELFSQGIGFDIRKVKRRIPQTGKPTQPLDPALREGPPFLEGIPIKGRYCVIYSKFDISCAIERDASEGCACYEYHDAIRIFVNVIRYALLQDIAYQSQIR